MAWRSEAGCESSIRFGWQASRVIVDSEFPARVALPSAQGHPPDRAEAAAFDFLDFALNAPAACLTGRIDTPADICIYIFLTYIEYDLMPGVQTNILRRIGDTALLPLRKIAPEKMARASC